MNTKNTYLGIRHKYEARVNFRTIENDPNGLLQYFYSYGSNSILFPRKKLPTMKNSILKTLGFLENP